MVWFSYFTRLYYSDNGVENPYAAAQKFLERNELPMSYLDEVVRFIEKNTAGVSLGGGSDSYVDPFTGGQSIVFVIYNLLTSFSGASRYQPSGSTRSTGGSDFMDPFTGASRLPGHTPLTQYCIKL